MSKKTETIELSPRYSSCKAERFVIGGFECPQCNGAGHHVKEVGRNDHIVMPCANCGGVGQLRATAIIDWSPDNKAL